MSNQVLSVKWFHEGEYRRFGLEIRDGSDVFALLLAKVQALAPGYNGALAWKDQDGDFIVFSSAAELQEALRSLRKDDVLRVFSVDREGGRPPMVRSESRMSHSDRPVAATAAAEQPMATDEPAVEQGPKRHPGVQCDGCDQPVFGIRFKCIDCPDYDLCAECETLHTHDHHTFLRIADPNNRTWRAAFWLNRHRRGSPGRRGRGYWGPWGAAWAQGGCPGRRGGGGGGGGGRRCRRPDAGEEGAAPDASAPNVEEAANAGLNFLHEVGRTVAAALGNLGIDVDVDVENNRGQREKVNTPSAPTAGEASAADTTRNIEVVNIATPPPAELVNIATPPPAAEAPAQDWTLLENPEILMDTSQQPARLYPSMPAPPAAPQPPVAPQPPAAAPAAPQLPMHPNPMIDSTMRHLMAMGFQNDGGWLTRLVEQKEGDINAVLNAVNPRT